MRSFILASTLLTASFVPVSTHATVLMNWDVQTLTAKSDLIVLATVVSKQSFAADNTVMTRTKLRVQRVLKGGPTNEIEILQLGGRLGARIVDVPGDAELAEGETYLLFTAQPTGQPYRSLVGMGLGAQRLDGDALKQNIDVPLMSSTGALEAAPGPRTRSLSEVLRAVREAER